MSGVWRCLTGPGMEAAFMVFASSDAFCPPAFGWMGDVSAADLWGFPNSFHVGRIGARDGFNLLCMGRCVCCGVLVPAYPRLRRSTRRGWCGVDGGTPRAQRVPRWDVCHPQLVGSEVEPSRPVGWRMSCPRALYVIPPWTASHRSPCVCLRMSVRVGRL